MDWSILPFPPTPPSPLPPLTPLSPTFPPFPTQLLTIFLVVILCSRNTHAQPENPHPCPCPLSRCPILNARRARAYVILKTRAPRRIATK
ncbi:hypothetical protein GY45DRAFT_671867 [Cubamyces sp. BRFM 1775]|nr:hypothetical protein GY45DRAFT_671867 [Cubamyces sp. BRFM 1775]